MRAKAVADQHSQLAVHSLPSPRMKHTFKPLEAYLGISVPKFRARVMPTRCVIRRLVTPVGSR